MKTSHKNSPRSQDSIERGVRRKSSCTNRRGCLHSYAKTPVKEGHGENLMLKLRRKQFKTYDWTNGNRSSNNWYPGKVQVNYLSRI